MSFAELNLSPSILKAIESCGYTEPTPIQEQSIPQTLEGKDVLASARTGTGKTAAFMLPVLQRLSTFKKSPKGAPRVLVLTPTRELASQVTQATRTYGKHVRFRSTFILGGMPYGPQFRDLSKPIDLVVGTPGRIIDHLDRGSLDLSNLEVLILDEADRMLDMGFKEDVEKITGATPAERQTLLFTATLDRTMATLASRLLRDPVRIDIVGKDNNHENIEQRLMVADNLQHKNRLLKHIAMDRSLTQAIVFSATKKDADVLARELVAEGHKAAALHGDMTQGARNYTLKKLRQGRIRLLVATDVAARGIDINGISHVINFDLPKNAEDYVHRIGRTGRAGATGIAISFASNADYSSLLKIQKYIGKEVPQTTIEGMEPTKPLKPPRRDDGKRRRPWGAKNKGNYNPRNGRGKKPGFKGGQKKTKREPIIEYR